MKEKNTTQRKSYKENPEEKNSLTKRKIYVWYKIYWMKINPI